MASRNNIRIASAIGTIHPDQLQTLLADGRYTQAQVAVIAGTTPARLAQLLAGPVPVPLMPRNWTATLWPGGNISRGRSVGSSVMDTFYVAAGFDPGGTFPLAAVPYTGGPPNGDGVAGYTYGAPIGSREDLS